MASSVPELQFPSASGQTRNRVAPYTPAVDFWRPSSGNGGRGQRRGAAGGRVPVWLNERMRVEHMVTCENCLGQGVRMSWTAALLSWTGSLVSWMGSPVSWMGSSVSWMAELSVLDGLSGVPGR